MLKRRVVATVVVQDGVVVQSKEFRSYLPVGRPEIAVEFLNRYGIDEIVLLDISCGKNGVDPDYEMVKRVTKSCRVPLTVGGGLTNLNQVKLLIASGADKVAFNHSAIYFSKLLEESAKVFGDQCVVASIDVIIESGKYKVYDYRVKKGIDQNPLELAKGLVELGVGEILLNAVDRDGMYNGFDLDLARLFTESLSVPVIISGGAGKPSDFAEVFTETSVEAAGAANFFHFNEHSVSICKSAIQEVANIRHESDALYAGISLDESGRINKRDEKYLDDLLYVYFEKETI